MKIYIGFAIDMDGAYNNFVNANGQIISKNHKHYSDITKKTNIFINGMNKLFNYFDKNKNNNSATWFINEATFKTSEIYPEIIEKCIKKGELGLHTHFDSKIFRNDNKCEISDNKDDWFEEGMVVPTKKLRKISDKYNRNFFIFKAGCHLRSDKMFDSLGELGYIYDTTMVYEDTVLNEDGTMRFDDTKLMLGTPPFFIFTKNGYRILEFPEIRPDKIKIKKHIDNSPKDSPIFIRLQVHPFDVMGNTHLKDFDKVIKFCKKIGHVEFKNIHEMGMIYIDYLMNKFAKKMIHKYNNLFNNDKYYISRKNNIWWQKSEFFILKYIFENYNKTNLKILDCFGGFGQIGLMLENLGYSNITILDFDKNRINQGLQISSEEKLNVKFVRGDFFNFNEYLDNDFEILISVNSVNTTLNNNHDKQIQIYEKLLKNNCIIYSDILRYGTKNNNGYLLFNKLINKMGEDYKKIDLDNNFIEIKKFKKKNEIKSFSNFFTKVLFIHKENYTSNFIYDKQINQKVINILFLNDNIKISSGIYFKFPISFYFKYNFNFPIKKYRFEFKCKVNKYNENFGLRVYTGIKYVIIKKKITENYQKIIIEDIFDFNKSSTYRIAFINPIKNLELFIYDPLIKLIN